MTSSYLTVLCCFLAALSLLWSCSDHKVEPDPPVIRFNPGFIEDNTILYGVWRRYWSTPHKADDDKIVLLDFMNDHIYHPAGFSAFDSEKQAGCLMLLVRVGDLSEETIAEDFERTASIHLLGSYADDCQSSRQQIMFLVTKTRATHAFVREGKLILQTENHGSASEN
jgi:hypothetical protein